MGRPISGIPWNRLVTTHTRRLCWPSTRTDSAPVKQIPGSMTSKLVTWLKPNGLGLILFLPCVALVQYLPILRPIQPAMIWLVVAAGAAAPAVLIGLQSIIVPYVIAMPLGRLLTIATRPKRRDIVLTVCATTAAALLAAVIVSKQYWGYYLRRPPLDERVAKARQVRSLTLVRMEQDADGKSRFVAHPDLSPTPRDLSLEEAIQWGRISPYDTPHYRSLVTLADRQLLPGTPPAIQSAMLASIYDWLEATGLLVSGEPGYPNAKRLGGVLLEFQDEMGEVLTFVGVRTGEVSNDHYAYCEFIFSVPRPGDRPRLLSAVRFFYDVAGIEGAEWWVMWLVFTALGSAITVPAAVILRALRRPAIGRPNEL
jgi:hypothetical protein